MTIQKLRSHESWLKNERSILQHLFFRKPVGNLAHNCCLSKHKRNAPFWPLGHQRGLSAEEDLLSVWANFHLSASPSRLDLCLHICQTISEKAFCTSGSPENLIYCSDRFVLNGLELPKCRKSQIWKCAGVPAHCTRSILNDCTWTQARRTVRSS